MNINIFCAAGPNILILSSLVNAHFPNGGDKRFLLGNLSMNLKHLPRDLLGIMGRKRSAQHPDIGVLKSFLVKLILKQVIQSLLASSVSSNNLNAQYKEDCCIQGCKPTRKMSISSQAPARVALWTVVRSHPQVSS